MKKLLLIILFSIMTLISHAQTDTTITTETTKTYKIVVGIPNITLDEFENIKNLIKESSIFEFTFYCSKEKVLVINSNLELSKEEVELLFSPAIEVEKIFYKEMSGDTSGFCDTNSDNKIIKQ